MDKIIAYIRASTDKQDVKNQRHEILEYCNKGKLSVDDFIEVQASTRKDSRQRRIDELLERLSDGDTLIVTELSRLGRSTGELIVLIDKLTNIGVRIRFIKQNLSISPDTSDIGSKVLVTVFSLLAELERDFISLRTKEALAAKKAQGIKLGKPVGTVQASMYDEDRERIEELLDHGVTQKSILEKHLKKGTLNSLNYYIKTRGLKKQIA
ncbi:MAG: recombinase family protein [Gammaproteobacteria bacterium]|nr:recombinase family protein [Gammaproteobacteria bacterium]